jgi:hypothetical protein
MDIIRNGARPSEPKKEKILSEHEITVALGQEKIPDKETVLKKMNKSVEKENLRKAVSHLTLLKKIEVNKLTDDTPGHEH